MQLLMTVLFCIAFGNAVVTNATSNADAATYTHTTAADAATC